MINGVAELIRTKEDGTESTIRVSRSPDTPFAGTTSDRKNH